MAINKKKIAVLDFETDGKNPRECNPVQLACIMIEPRFLEIMPDSEFNSLMRPPNIDEESYWDDHQEVLAFHSKVQKKSKEEIFEEWKEAPEAKVVMENFSNYLSDYHTRYQTQNIFSAPILAGFNNHNFDDIILDKLCTRFGYINKYGESNIFWKRDECDVLKMVFLWFENLEEPKGYSQDALREFFGMSKDGAHDALVDVTDTANILIKFLKLHRSIAKNVTFKNSFKK